MEAEARDGEEDVEEIQAAEEENPASVEELETYRDTLAQLSDLVKQETDHLKASHFKDYTRSVTSSCDNPDYSSLQLFMGPVLI